MPIKLNHFFKKFFYLFIIFIIIYCNATQAFCNSIEYDKENRDYQNIYYDIESYYHDQYYYTDYEIDPYPNIKSYFDNNNHNIDIISTIKRPYYKDLTEKIKAIIPTGQCDIIFLYKINGGNNPKDFFKHTMIGSKVLDQMQVEKDRFHSFNTAVMSFAEMGREYIFTGSNDGIPRYVLDIEGSYYMQYKTSERVRGKHFEGIFRFMSENLDKPIEINNKIYNKRLVHYYFHKKYLFDDADKIKIKFLRQLDKKLEDFDLNSYRIENPVYLDFSIF